MAVPHCTCRTILSSSLITTSSRPTSLPLSFLLPAFVQTSAFSTTNPFFARKDGNIGRGVSAIRRTGLNKRQRLSVDKQFRLRGLPKPVLDPQLRSALDVDPNHGLWQFLPPHGSAVETPTDVSGHGREWTVEELKNKDWDDLHRLWWMCVKERNRVATGENERESAAGKGMYGRYESGERLRTVEKTQKNIRIVLTTRFYAWEDARSVAMDDAEVDLYADPQQGEDAYLPTQATEQTTNQSGSHETGDQTQYQPNAPVTQPEARA